jgi:hypothetical protein
MQLPVLLEPEDFVVLKSTKTGSLKLVQIGARLNKGLYLLRESVNGLEYRFLISIPKKTMEERGINGFESGKCTLITDQNMVVLGSPDCNELDQVQKTGFVIFFYYGIARIGELSPKLFFKEDALKLQKPNLLRVDKSEYLLAKKGPLLSSTMEVRIPRDFIDILEFWSLDTSAGQPQYLDNKLLLMKSDHEHPVKNMISFSVKKNYFPNNLRLLLHGAGDIYDSANQLFFIDLDEDNL